MLFYEAPDAGVDYCDDLPPDSDGLRLRAV